MHPNTDIVIAIRGTRPYPIEQYFVECLRTLEEHTKNYRLILVDDNSDEEGARVINEAVSQRPEAVLIRTGFQRWFTRAYNLGLRLARTERTVILNADTVLGAGWLEELYDVWDEATSVGHRVGLVGSVYSDPEQRRWIASMEPGYVTAHCLLLSMQAISEASARRGQPGIYLDETRQDAIHIRSDVFISYELNRLGWATIQSHKSAVGHHGGKAWGHNLGAINCVALDQVAERYK